MADPDPIVAEVRRAREALAQKFNCDLDAMCADARDHQGADGAKVVHFPPRPVQSTPPAAGGKRRKVNGGLRKTAAGSR